MVLDSLTILFALAPLSLMVGVVLYLVWLRQRAEPGLRLWALSLMLRVPAFLLLSARGQIPDVWSIAIANGILLVGVGLGVKATRSFGRRATPMIAVLLPCMIWGVLCLIPGIYDHDQNRLIAVTLLQATCSGIIAFEFTRSVVGGRKVCLALAGLIGAMTLVQVVRIGIALASEETIVLAASNASLAATIYLQLIAVFLGGLFAATIFLDAQLKDLRRQASEDSLTGALNREAFQTCVELALDRAEREGEEAVLLAIDLDRFKALNDALGHGEGDRVLALFGARLREILPDGALFGRLGGDEFAILLSGPAVRTVAGLASSICGLLGRRNRDPEHRGAAMVTASVGLARAMPGERFALLLARADAALYDAKRNGRDQVSIAAPVESREVGLVGDAVQRLAIVS